MGSGTTAVESVLQGMTPLGVEIDSFARLVAEVSVRAYNSEGLQRLQETFRRIEASWKKYSLDYELAPRLHNVEYWFNEQQFEDLIRLKQCLYRVIVLHNEDFDFFRVVFADIVRPCSRIERQTLKPYISRKYTKTPADVGGAFSKSFKVHFKALEEYSQQVVFRSKPIKWVGTDATCFNGVKNSVDVAITSPPYINALDYVRCIKIESSWVDCGSDTTFGEMRASMVGDVGRKRSSHHQRVTELVDPLVEKIRRVDERRAMIVLSYFCDMFDNLCCTYQSLKPGAEYHLVVGDSVIRGVSIPTHTVLVELGQSVGFEWGGILPLPNKGSSDLNSTAGTRRKNRNRIRHFSAKIAILTFSPESTAI